MSNVSLHGTGPAGGQPSAAPGERIRLLIVDDSAYVRHAVARQVRSDPDIDVVGCARNGAEAVKQVQELKPDVVTMDVVMPVMDGLHALENIMSSQPTPVVMLSSFTRPGADSTLKALELGAVDFFLKHSVSSPAGTGEAADDLIRKVKAAARAKVSLSRPGAICCLAARRQEPRRQQNSSVADTIVVIGTSTGGPRALYELVPALPADMPAAVLIVQHMPPGFTRSLAQRLDQASSVEVKEAQEGDLLSAGRALVAPGDYHMTVSRAGVVALSKGPRIMGLRPAVDVTMESAASVFGPSCIGVILTGMGSDGTRGAALIKDAGGKVIAEDESTCAVWGMPRSVIQAGKADRIVPLQQVAQELTGMLQGKEVRHDGP